jgi:hypothetical protein
MKATLWNAGMVVVVALVQGCGGTPAELTEQTAQDTHQAVGAPAVLLFSEYVEGTGYNKALELVNPQSKDVALDGYQLRLWANGATQPTATLFLDGIISAHQTLVICHPHASAALLGRCDLTDDRVTTFNGNDALELVHVGAELRVVDTFGDLHPAAPFWGAGVTRTMDATLRRDCSVAHGNAAFPSRFSPSMQWDPAAEDDFSDVGAWHCNK